MTRLEYVQQIAIPSAYDLLPDRMRTKEATAMLLAIGLQESGFTHRRQVRGPARGFWQFERGGGVVGVLEHKATRKYLLPILSTLGYPDDSDACYVAIEHNDVLAAAFARLLLWTVPEALPVAGEQNKGWRQYLEAWRPGKPHPARWPDHFAAAWQLV